MQLLNLKRTSIDINVGASTSHVSIAPAGQSAATRKSTASGQSAEHAGGLVDGEEHLGELAALGGCAGRAQTDHEEREEDGDATHGAAPSRSRTRLATP